eukprot:c28826_g1_i2 orf=126-1061(+)
MVPLVGRSFLLGGRFGILQSSLSTLSSISTRICGFDRRWFSSTHDDLDVRELNEVKFGLAYSFLSAQHTPHVLIYMFLSFILCWVVENDNSVHLTQEMESIFGSPVGTFSPFNSASPQSKIEARKTEQPIQGPMYHSPNVFESSAVSGLPDDGILSHVDSHGQASMVDVSNKVPSKRVAVASGKVFLGPVAFGLLSSNQIAKGDVLTVAKIAGICGAKQTGNVIPLCHNIALSNVKLKLTLDVEENAVDIRAEVCALGSTGVEMEALTAVSVAGLTVYDMCKAVSKDIKICSIQLESKTGGKSGDWLRSSP